MSARCLRCGQEWPRDPALEVGCPLCGAAVGVHCTRPSGHKARVHAARDRLALEKVPGYAECPEEGDPLDYREHGVEERSDQLAIGL